MYKQVSTRHMAPQTQHGHAQVCPHRTTAALSCGGHADVYAQCHQVAEMRHDLCENRPACGPMDGVMVGNGRCVNRCGHSDTWWHWIPQMCKQDYPVVAGLGHGTCTNRCVAGTTGTWQVCLLNYPHPYFPADVVGLKSLNARLEGFSTQHFLWIRECT